MQRIMATADKLGRLDVRQRLEAEQDQVGQQFTSEALRVRSLVGLAEGAGSLQESLGGALAMSAIVQPPGTPGFFLRQALKTAGEFHTQAGRAKAQRWAELGRGVGGGPVAEAAEGLAATAVSSAPAIPAAVVGGLPAAVAVAGAQQAGSTWNDAREALRPRWGDQADLVAVPVAAVSGAITAAVTRGFGATGIEALAKGFSKQTARQLVREGFKQAGLEATEEMVDQTGQELWSALTYRPEQTVGQAVKHVLFAGAAGGILGGGTQVVSGGVGRVTDRLENELAVRRVDSPALRQSAADLANRASLPTSDLGDTRFVAEIPAPTQELTVTPPDGALPTAEEFLGIGPATEGAPAVVPAIEAAVAPASGAGASEAGGPMPESGDVVAGGLVLHDAGSEAYGSAGTKLGLTFSSGDLKEFRVAKTQWLDGGASLETADALVNRFYRPGSHGWLKGMDPIYVSVPSTSGRNLLPLKLGERLAQDYGGVSFGGEVGVAASETESKHKTGFWAKLDDPVRYAPGASLAELQALAQLRPVVIVEDAHNTGESWMRFRDFLEANGVRVSGAAALVGSDARMASPRDRQRLAERIAAATNRPLDTVLPLVEHEFNGATKQWFNYAERAAARNPASAERLVAALERRRSETGGTARSHSAPDAPRVGGTRPQQGNHGSALSESPSLEAADGVSGSLPSSAAPQMESGGPGGAALEPGQLPGGAAQPALDPDRFTRALSDAEWAQLEQALETNYEEHIALGLHPGALGVQYAYGFLDQMRQKPRFLSIVLRQIGVMRHELEQTGFAASVYQQLRAQHDVYVNVASRLLPAGANLDKLVEIAWWSTSPLSLAPASQAPGRLHPQHAGLRDLVRIFRESNPQAPAVRLVHEPGWAVDGFGVQGTVDGGVIVLNTAYLPDVDTARRVLREEHAHALLGSEAGQAEIRAAVDSALAEFSLENLAGRYQRQPGEEYGAWRRRLIEEQIAKGERDPAPWWRRVLDRIRAWLAKHGLTTLTPEEIGRAIMRRLREPGALDRQPVFNESNPAHENASLSPSAAGERGNQGHHGGREAAAARYLRLRLGADATGARTAEALSRQGALLVEWARASNLILDPAALSGLRMVSQSTAEHTVRYRAADDRAVKVTLPGAFGVMPNALGAPQAATPLEYLDRIRLMNRVFDADLRLEGVVLQPSNLIGVSGSQPSLVVSQPWITAPDPRQPLPTMAEIAARLEREGFNPLKGSFHGWRRASDGVVVLDARPDNFIRSASGLVPIDLVMFQERGADAVWSLAEESAAKPLPTEPVLADELTLRRAAFNGRFETDPTVAAAIRAGAGEQWYAQIPNELTAAQAATLLQQWTLPVAMERIRDESAPISHRVRVALAEAALRQLDTDYKAAEAAGQAREAAVLLDRAVGLAEWTSDYGTRLGQGVQAFALWSHLSPEGFVRTYRRAVDRANTGTARTRQRRAALKGIGKAVRFEPDLAKRIYAAARDALKKPAGFQRDEAIADVLAMIARAKGISFWDVVSSIWYANVLSGVATQVRNTAGNLQHLLAEAVTHATVHPGSTPALLSGLFLGAYRGALDAGAVLRTGKVTGTRVTKVEQPRVLELMKFRGPAYPLNAWKYVFRAMAATDMLFFRSAEEMKSYYLARLAADQQGLRGRAARQRVADLLWPGRSRAEAAQQAQREGLRGLALRRRVEELLREGRPEQLVQQAADYGRFATYNQAPEGVIGALVRAVNQVGAQVPLLRMTLVPFTNVVGNVMNNALNYTPWGYATLFAHQYPGLLGAVGERAALDAGPDEFKLQAARATLGTLGMAALGALVFAHLREEDPPIALTATGPRDPNRANQLRETGWKPYTAKVGGKFYDYRTSPLAPVLAILGQWSDAVRYNKLEAAPDSARLAYALQSVASVMLNQSFLSSLADFLGDVTRPEISRRDVPFKGFTRSASTFLVPNVAREIDRVFDPTVYDTPTIEAALASQFPVVRSHAGLPVRRNLLGEVIRLDAQPFVSPVRPSPVWQLIARNQAWISTPSRQTLIHDRPITSEEYDRLVRTSGQQIKAQIEDRLPLLRTMPRTQVQEEVREIVRQERAKAKRLIEESAW
jgi:hypothetical protein